MTEALLVWDEPVLNSRFHRLLTWEPHEEQRDRLHKLPAQVLKVFRLVSRGACEWERGAPGGVLAEDFLRRGNRLLLVAFLETIENQIRLLAFMAHHAPTRETRRHFDDANDLQRGIAATLRSVLAQAQESDVDSRRASGRDDGRRPELRSVQEEDGDGNLREQVEGAVRQMRQAGKEPREVLLSVKAQRQLRDEGLFREGETTIQDVPVVVDMGWEASAFAVRTFDSVPLEEIMAPAAPADRG